MKTRTMIGPSSIEACLMRGLGSRVSDVFSLKRILRVFALAMAVMGPHRMLAAAPAVNNASGASGVLSISAVLNGTLTSTGGVPTQAAAYWGETDGGTLFGSWGHTVDLGTNASGPLSLAVTNLMPNRTYYYRFYATNVDGEAWASSTTNFQTRSSSGPAAVNLGTNVNFTLLAGSEITTTGGGTVTGDAGVSPAAGSTIGLTDAQVNGIIYAVDDAGPSGSINNPTLLTAAKGDLTIAYNDARDRTPVPVGPFLNPGSPPGNIGGLNLVPGLYKFTTEAHIEGSDLTLTGGPDDVWIFQVGSALIVGADGRKVILAGGAQARNVFWQVGTSATIGTFAEFKGTIMADQAITLDTSSVLVGRALARIAHVVFNGASASLPAAAPVVTNLTLTIISAHGTGTPLADLPPTGIAYTNVYGATLTNRITGTETFGGTQYVNAGWSMTGNAPVSGSTNRMTLVLTNNAVLTWQWGTNYTLSLEAQHGSITNATSGWKPAGSLSTLTPVADVGYVFDHWVLNGQTVGAGVPLYVTMDGAKDAIAVFRSIFIDVTAQVSWNVNWVFDPRKGYFLGTLTIANTNSQKILLAPIWFEVQSTEWHWLRFPTGIDAMTGMHYLDLSAAVTNQLRGIGNGDQALDVGEAVTVTGIELMGRRTPLGLVVAVWADPPGAESADTDGDGMPDVNENVAGTSAMDPNSVFQIRLGPDGRSVQWDSQPNRSYKVLMSANLSQGFVTARDNIKGSGAPATYTAEPQVLGVGTEGAVFFRVEVKVK